MTSNIDYQIEEHHLNLDLKLPSNEIKPEITYCYVMVSRLLSKNPKKEDGLPSIDHEILIDLEETIEINDYNRIMQYIIMLEYSKKDYPMLIKKISSIIKKYKKLLKK